MFIPYSVISSVTINGNPRGLKGKSREKEGKTGVEQGTGSQIQITNEIQSGQWLISLGKWHEYRVTGLYIICEICSGEDSR